MGGLSCCGTDCTTCEYYGELCKGCNESKGQVFHVEKGKACPIFQCSINENEYKNCGQCKEVPCGIWRNTRDPKFSDEEFELNVQGRMEALK